MNPQRTENRKTKLTTTMASKRLSENGEEKNTIKYTIWNVRKIDHKEEELDSVLNEKKIKIAEN
jgi:hypothetical protein